MHAGVDRPTDRSNRWRNRSIDARIDRDRGPSAAGRGRDAWTRIRPTRRAARAIATRARARRSGTIDAKVVEIVRPARAVIGIEDASREGVKGATGIVERTRDGRGNGA